MAYIPLIEITFDGTLHRVALESMQLDVPWDDHVISQDPLQFRSSEKYGGYCKLEYGSIDLSYELFSAHWPPPVSGQIVYKLYDNEALTSQTVFEASLYIAQFDARKVTYDLFGKAEDTNALDELENYDGDTVPMPRALGAVLHVNPIRLPGTSPDTSAPRYHKGNISGTVGSDWHVFDDGVNIDTNVSDAGDGSFKLSAVPVGEVTMTGTGTIATLVEIMTWAATQLSYSIDTSKAKSPSPQVAHWLETQDFILNALSPVIAFFRHYFYIIDTTLYLVDADSDNGTRTVADNTEDEFFPPNYFYHPPIRQISSEWKTGESFEGTVEGGDGTETGKYVKRTDRKVEVLSSYSFGEKMSLVPYHNDLDTVKSALENILATLHKSNISVPLPMIAGSYGIPAIGEKITLIDTALGENLQIVFRVRAINWNSQNDEFIVDGEGDVQAVS